MNEIETTGIITSVMPTGDYDKRIVILTKDIGRISAFIKFARRINSRFIGCSREFVCAKFKLYRGGSSYSVIDMEVINYFEDIFHDINKTNYGMYFLDIVNYYTRENNNETQSLKFLYRTFQVLEKGLIPLKLQRAIFELKSLVFMGEYPNFQAYLDTGNKIEKRQKYLFSIEKNGLVERNGIELNLATLKAMDYIIRAKTTDVYSFRLDTAYHNEFINIIEKYFKKTINYDFKTLNVFDWYDELKNIR